MNAELKDEIRKKVLSLLRKQTKEERKHKSRQILDRLFVIPEFQKAAHVLFYAAFDGEVETLEMMQ